MKIEVEQKFRVDDPAALKMRLTELGVRFDAPISQVDAYYNHPCRDFSQTDEALRIRTVGADNFVTYKGPKLDREVKSRKEMEFPLQCGGGADEFTEFLLALSFRPSAKVKKLRSSARLNFRGVDYELAWDEVEGIGTFLEIELVVEQNAMVAAKTQILALQAEFELTAVERRSYLEMVLERGD